MKTLSKPKKPANPSGSSKRSSFSWQRPFTSVDKRALLSSRNSYGLFRGLRPFKVRGFRLRGLIRVY